MVFTSTDVIYHSGVTSVLRGCGEWFLQIMNSVRIRFAVKYRIVLKSLRANLVYSVFQGVFPLFFLAVEHDRLCFCCSLAVLAGALLPPR